MLTEIKSKTEHYFVDEQNRRQGVYKRFHDNGQLWEHTFYQNDKRHGEYKLFKENGTLDFATYIYQGINLHVDPDTLTEKDKTYILLSGRLPPRD